MRDGTTPSLGWLVGDESPAESEAAAEAEAPGSEEDPCADADPNDPVCGMQSPWASRRTDSPWEGGAK